MQIKSVVTGRKVLLNNLRRKPLRVETAMEVHLQTGATMKKFASNGSTKC